MQDESANSDPTLRKQQHPRMLASIVARTVNYALAQGVSMEEVQQETHLRHIELIDPEGRVSEDVLPALWELLNRPGVAMGTPVHMAVGTTSSVFGPWALGSRYAPTLRAALQTMIRYTGVLSDLAQVRQTESGDELIVVPHHPLQERSPGLANVAMLAMAAGMLIKDLGIGAALRRVELAGGFVGPRSEYVNHFRAPVLPHRGRDALVFDMALLDLPTNAADPVLWAYARRNLDDMEERWVLRGERMALARLYQVLLQEGQEAGYRAEEIASRMNMSLRALQRQVKQHGLMLRSVIEEAREARAKELMAAGRHSLPQIAELVGYSDVRAFRRAFGRWTGSSPSGFRRSLETFEG